MVENSKADAAATNNGKKMPSSNASSSHSEKGAEAKPPQKKLSNKELKMLKKKAKAAKRAARKAANQNGQQSSQGVKTASHIKKQMISAKIKDSNVRIPPMFGHLETREERISASPVIASIVHPSILSLTLKMSTYKVVGSTSRCVAMLDAFKDVIKSYKTPQGTSLQRNLTSHLSHQIEYLKTGRPLSISMGNAIRWLKQRISLVPIDMSDDDGKKMLLDEIDQFIKEKIVYSDRVIAEYASRHIQNNFKFLHMHIHKFWQKKSNIDFCFLGAHAMLSNGRLYSRVGTALVAMAAKKKNIPVLVCCESLKFSDKVQLDSVTLNELGDSDDLINTRPFNKVGFNLQQYLNKIEERKGHRNGSNNGGHNGNRNRSNDNEADVVDDGKDTILRNWKELRKLYILNILYDLTPPDYIQKVITELGALPPSSVPVILREYKSIS
ncbi:hypothetical protein BRETT_000714 [Brettanomyces bruxellensis]|uniref:Translation initiation factor eIF2B subunit delta n=1 Tax=Dekkera bruxellensis TaxID=5007 RepID=A0A871R2M0_DEKBR|nr:uncharacterized protein BRETT_000714 [Brettanomyces bruxellensis]QOU20997.1 hypothetical protein BRETT_000714 [Brettanomyces bruxellensis]